MKTKTKLIASIMSICLVCAVFAIGVFALKTANLKIGGDVSFSATGVEATISNAALTGMTTPNGFATGGTIDTTMTQSQIDEQFTTWQNLSMQFDENGTDIGFSFNIKNEANATTEKNNYIEINYSYSFGEEDVNVDVFPATTNNYIVKPGATNSFGFVVKVLDKELDVAQTSLSINVVLKHTSPSVGTLVDGKITTTDGLIYTVGENNTASLEADEDSVGDNYTSEIENAVIAPVVSDGTNNYIVTTIGGNAFSCSNGDINNDYLKSVYIPNSVTNIGDNAFNSCKYLTAIEIPYSVTNIGERAFEYCSSLTSITIPNSVTKISNSSFYGCTSLKTITIPNSVTDIGDKVFYESGLTSISIPSGVTRISDYTFYGCTSLKTITIPSSVTSIGANAFEDAGLDSVTIPSSVTSIGDYAFANNGMTNINIPEGVIEIGEYAFRGNGVIEVTIPSSVTSMGGYEFEECSDLQTVTLLNNSISEGMFMACASLKKLTIGRNVKTIGSDVFATGGGDEIVLEELIIVSQHVLGTSWNAVVKTNAIYINKLLEFDASDTICDGVFVKTLEDKTGYYKYIEA